MELDLKEAFDNHEACYWVSPERRDINGGHFLLVAIAREAGFYQTHEVLAIDYKVAKLITRKRNRFLGISRKAALKIVNSSILLQFELMALMKDMKADGPSHKKSK